MVTVGVCLSGCGFLDGAEITEAVATLIALDQAGARALCMAPRVELDEVDHLTGKPTGARREVLRESARIARGQIRDIREIRFTDLDALVFPGGFGAAKNLSDFAKAGPEAHLHPDVARLMREMHEAQKPLGFICIAPALAAILFRGTLTQAHLTIGEDPGTASALSAMGAVHEARPVHATCLDTDNRIVSTPAYMLGPGPAAVFRGIKKLIEELLGLVR